MVWHGFLDTVCMTEIVEVVLNQRFPPPSISKGVEPPFIKYYKTYYILVKWKEVKYYKNVLLDCWCNSTKKVYYFPEWFMYHTFMRHIWDVLHKTDLCNQWQQDKPLYKFFLKVYLVIAGLYLVFYYCSYLLHVPLT